MKVLVTGAGGMLAHALVPRLREEGYAVTALRREDLDITDQPAVESRVVEVAPECIVQCAAYTAVDAAESNVDEAFRINAEGTAHVARAARGVGALLVYPSTDYVFSGLSTVPWSTDDAVAPINRYGESKLAGEEAARLAERSLILRTSWLYGAGGRHFVDTMLRLSEERDELRVVDDQVGRPTWTETLADAIARLIRPGEGGVLHITDGGQPTTWFGFAHAILSRRGREGILTPVSSAEYPTPARRPSYSVLDLRAAEERLGYRLPDWRLSLSRFLDSRLPLAAGPLGA